MAQLYNSLAPKTLNKKLSQPAEIYSHSPACGYKLGK